MKKNLILAVVVVAALSLAGASGVFATWSDSEVSLGNTIETGSLDLKVNGADDQRVLADGTVLWGEGVPAKVKIECMVPGLLYGPYEVELWNAGECQFPSKAFIHVKTLECDNVEPKINPYPDGGSPYWPAGESTGYPDPSVGLPYSGDLKPEPELVAEYGGKVDCTMVPGVGVDGDDCSMGTGLRMTITASLDPADILVNPQGVLLQDLLGKWECNEIYLFDLMPCEPRTIYLWFYLGQDSEEDFFDGIADFIVHPDDMDPVPTGEAYDAALRHWEKFNDWPSWRYMKDKVTFAMEYDLWLDEPMFNAVGDY